MDERSRVRMGCGLVLVLGGLFLLAVRLVPSLERWYQTVLDWPLIIVGVGVFLFLFGVLVNAPGMAVPAAIVGGIGGLLYWQNATGNWESWAYAWTLIPGFVGVGTVLMGVLQGGRAENLRGGAWLILISLILFAVFGTFLGGMDLLGPYWPVLIILLGVILLGQSFLGSRRRRLSEE